MDRKSVLVAAVVFALLAYAPEADAASMCDQTFVFLGWQQIDDETVVWIREDLGGDCQYSEIHRVGIQDETVSVSSRSSGLEVSVDGRIFESFSRSPDGWVLPRHGIALWDPGSRPELIETWRKTIIDGARGAFRFNQDMGPAGVAMPEISGARAELVYFHPRGLYIDYSIAAVHVLPESRVLLLFTEQSRRGVGMDTMHGFLVFRGNVD